jgi:hypothetical protein
MKIQNAVLVRIALASIALTLNSSWATEQCAPWRDSAKQLVIGSHELGLARAAFPLTLPHDKCGDAPSPEEEVCEYFDADGVGYLVDQTGVIRIEARKARAKPTATLPAGLLFGDSETVVRRKLAKLPTESPATALAKSRPLGKTIQSRAWATFNCIETSHKVMGSFYVTFDHYGRLNSIGMRLTV